MFKMLKINNLILKPILPNAQRYDNYKPQKSIHQLCNVKNG